MISSISSDKLWFDAKSASSRMRLENPATDLSTHDQHALDSIADLLNNRPRQTLNWRSLTQAFAELRQGMAERDQAIPTEPFVPAPRRSC